MNFNHPIRILTVLLLVSLASFSKETGNDILRKISFSHPVNYFPQSPDKSKGFYRNMLFGSVPETLNVYAIRVQFKPDNNNQTTGDGRFDLSNNYPDSVDAPPHDSLYFVYKLEFLKNYYFKASKGKLVINYFLLPTVRNLPNEMEFYSPRRNENLRRMGQLFYDVWRSADSVIDFSGISASNSAFIIFHAGVGRDVDLASQGIFQGELDIPSIYLGNTTLKALYGDTTQGYYTNEGLIIPSSCILPEQQWRIINTSFGSFFLELGMNGIVVATIGSHLGLPDLFDTRTGRTAIGRFGLMDGQAIFSYLGVFPPEPSAWEKQYLGWAEPVIINSNGTYTSKAASIDFNGNESVYKVLISGKEYFLVENRNRDASGNGQTIYFVHNGIRDSVRFNQDVSGFNNSDIWKLKGSIINVDELDWSLPGLKNDTADFQGGILIWHIDENIIDANITTNTINVNINHRGVDLEEAKGSQDIGVIVRTPIGDIISDGFFVDFWYNGNHYRPPSIYRNEFTPNSIPNSKSYSNVNSRICISEFSTIDPVMTFRFELCGSITNINTFPKYVGRDTSVNAQPIGFDLNSNGYDEIFINVKDSLYGFRDNGNPIRTDIQSGYLYDSCSGFQPAYINRNIGGFSNFIAAVYKNKVTLLNFTIDSLTTLPNVFRYELNSEISTPILNLLDDSIVIGSISGKIFKTSLSAVNFISDSLSPNSITSLAKNSISYIYSDVPGGRFTLGLFDNQVRKVYSDNNKLYIDGNPLQLNPSVSRIHSSPVCADITRNGNQQIIFTADDKLYAVNQFGVPADNFPFRITGVNSITGGCSVADINGDGIYEIIFGTGDGRVYAYGVNGRVVEGFPLQTGAQIKSTPALVNSEGRFGIVVYSTDGYLYGFRTPWAYDESKILWRNHLKDRFHSNSNFTLSQSSISGPCLPKEKVYNYPNPAYGSSTNIRYFLGGDVSSVKVRIMDLSGELVALLIGTTNKGFENEVSWDISNVQSGIYIALVEPEGGCSEKVMIKIAVVK
ncbi:MAG: T9SS type A sorting domain-containing protein [Ignavibacteria bacterium]|nr:T9SS type A sorting domain-containing protein [Ignavibacteria bacterium]